MAMAVAKRLTLTATGTWTCSISPGSKGSSGRDFSIPHPLPRMGWGTFAGCSGVPQGAMPCVPHSLGCRGLVHAGDTLVAVVLDHPGALPGQLPQRRYLSHPATPF